MASKRNVVKWKDSTPAASVTIFGISSHENDYRLSWCLNNELGLSFAQAEDWFETNDGKEFSCFEHQDDDQLLRLISNRCENGFLLKKYKNLDFLLRFQSELCDVEKTEWLQKLRKATLVSAVFEMPDLRCLPNSSM